MIDPKEFARLNRLLTGRRFTTFHTGLEYEVLGLCKDWPAESVKVVHRGLTGWDKGNLHSCSLAHFATNFEPVEPAPEPATIYERAAVNAAGRVADNSDKSSGV